MLTMERVQVIRVSQSQSAKRRSLIKNGHLQVRSASEVLAHSSKGPASLGVKQPAIVSKNRAKVTVSEKLLDAVLRIPLTRTA